AAPAVDADEALRLRGRPARRETRCSRQISAQSHEFAIGARGQRFLEPLVELFGGQPPVTRGCPQQFGDPLPVLVRRAQFVRSGRGPTGRASPTTGVARISPRWTGCGRALRGATSILFSARR